MNKLSKVVFLVGMIAAINTAVAFGATWKNENGKWHAYDGQNMLTGWVSDNNKWYYLEPDGSMLTDGYTPSGYHVDANGVYDGQKLSVKGISDTDKAAYENEIISLVNSERAANGLPQLKQNDTLMKIAGIRAVEMETLYEHTRPDGRSCFTLFDECGYDYLDAGENISEGYKTPTEVVKA